MEVTGNFNRVAGRDYNEVHLHFGSAEDLAKLMRILSDQPTPSLSLILNESDDHFSLRADALSETELRDRRSSLKRDMWWARWSKWINTPFFIFASAFLSLIGMIVWSVRRTLELGGQDWMVLLLPADGMPGPDEMLPLWLYAAVVAVMLAAAGLWTLRRSAAQGLQDDCRARITKLDAELLRLRGRR